MQTQKAFSTPGYPHVTILSIQPQRARTQEELLCTEVWTLYYWLQQLYRRAVHTTDQSTNSYNCDKIDRETGRFSQACANAGVYCDGEERFSLPNCQTVRNMRRKYSATNRRDGARTTKNVELRYGKDYLLKTQEQNHIENPPAYPCLE